MKFWTHLWFLLLFLAGGLILCGIVLFALSPLSVNGHMVAYLHLVQWSQNLFVMMAAPLAWMWFVQVRPSHPEGNGWHVTFDALHLTHINYKYAGLTLLFMLAAIPVMDSLEVFNSRLPWPESIRQYAEDESLRNMTVIQTLLSTSGLFGWIENILLMCVSTAIGEELLFRGALLHSFRREGGMSIHLAACLVGLLFALIHFELFGLIPRWFLGTLFVYLVYWSKSLWTPILAHCLNNLFALIAYKQASPEELSQVVKDYTFSPIWIVLSALVSAYLLWQMQRLSPQKANE
jgi:membrane protease YdiL (CAAX protease family)